MSEDSKSLLPSATRRFTPVCYPVADPRAVRRAAKSFDTRPEAEEYAIGLIMMGMAIVGIDEEVIG